MKRSTILSLIILTAMCSMSFYAGTSQTISAQKPFRPVCWQNDPAELPGFTPAEWIERHGIKNMVYEQLRLKCRGEIAGHMMDWDADQFWLKRVGANKVTTR